jgi:hypothetical protein
VTHTRALARAVLRSLDRATPEAVALLPVALKMAGGAGAEFASPFEYYADVLQDEAVGIGADHTLAEIAMTRALRVAARHPGCGELLDRLEGAESPPWPTLRNALLEVRGG